MAEIDTKPSERPKSTTKFKEEEKRQSKHSSITSEVDLAVAETSISEAVVKAVSGESFAVLETGNTVRFSAIAIETKSESSLPEQNQVSDVKRVESIVSNIESESSEVCHIQKTYTTNTESSSADINNTNPEHESSKNNLNAEVIPTNANPDEEMCLSKGKYEKSENQADQTSGHQEEKADIMKMGEGNENQYAVDGHKKSCFETMEPEIPHEAATVLKDKKENECEVVKNESKPLMNKDVKSNEESKYKSNVACKSDQMPLQTISVENNNVPVSHDMTKDMKNSNEPETTSKIKEDQNSQVTPEAVASAAKALTTTLAKQMVDATRSLTNQMIGSVSNELTLYNGSTMELADVDYFVIFKADDPKPRDGIAFIARMELGTNSISKVIPISVTKAWVAYYGGGVKLIDTEKEAVVNKIEVPGLDSITTAEESYLFVSNLGHSRIEMMHIVGEGVSGSSSLVNLSKCRIACMCMTKSGKNILICVEKRNSCLCIPRKSEIAIEVFQLNGKRLKEMKLKVNGRPSLPNGFPIVMCENENCDVCIASFNHADHTCSVEVYNTHLERRFVYDGDKSLSPRFMCEDMCCDSKGNILMLDNSLKAVHIVSKDGILVKLIPTPTFQIENPKCINVDSSDRLWIGQGPPGQMIILEYFLEQTKL